MGFQNRKMFLSNEDIPVPPLHRTTPSPPPAARKHLRPILSSDVAYTFLIVFSALFFITVLLLAAREFFLRYLRRSQHPPCRRDDDLADKSLQVCSYGSMDDTRAAQDCAVCLEEFQEGDTVKVTPQCGHVFHPRCIDTWLINHVTCPVCRCARIYNGIPDDRAAEDGGAGRQAG